MGFARCMTVPMFMDQIGAFQEFLVSKNIVGAAFGRQTAGVQDITPISGVSQIAEIVRGDNH